ncbi:MAG: Na/Pi cotransporter family protein [Oligosphaeraceae bacterium]|nr:Na/Pi cotransporter family protein [Oligosphaeraceae bacterium]
MFTSCSNEVERLPSQISLQSGARRTGMPNTDCAEDLVVQVSGPLRRIGLGSHKRRNPVPDVLVRIEPLDAENADTILTPEGRTDQGGLFRSKMRFGKHIGDQYYKVSCPEHENLEPIYFYLINGIEVSGNNQQTIAGDELPTPIQIRVGSPEEPRAGVPVFFKLTTDSDKARLSENRVLTNSKGIASTRLITGSGYTGRHELLAEIGERDGQGTYKFRAIPITALSLSWGTLLIDVLGGLALFIYGMMMMSEGLQLIAGNRLKNILQMFTGNRFSAVLAGLGVTALIQSSSACTVMVVGFVNAGLLNLQQAIGVIFGAAVGTTVTAQMVSFKLEILALPAICIGVLVLLIAKRSNSRGIAYTILGFGVLFFGMMLMSDKMKVISDFPTFKAAFQHFDCTPNIDGKMPFHAVIGAITVGLVLTTIVQSSSATVGITIAMAQSGLLNFYTAVPLVLGNNIGTTVTGLLASMKGTRVAKQAAISATIFKALAVTIMVFLFYLPWNGEPCFMHLVDLITSGNVFAEHPENIGRHVANAHTVFNIVAVLLFMPFINIIAWISGAILPFSKNGKDKLSRICHMEQNLLNAPSAALDHTISALTKMCAAAIDSSRDAVTAFVNVDLGMEEKIKAQEAMIDLAQHDIIDYLIKLTRRNLNEQQSAFIPVMMHCVNDVERIGDRAINILELVKNLEATSSSFSQKALLEIKEIELALSKTGQLLVDAINANDYTMIDKVIKNCNEISMMAGRFEQNHEVRLRSKDCSVENGVIYVELLANLDRISAHLLNIAERAQDIFRHRLAFRSGEKIRTNE